MGNVASLNREVSIGLLKSTFGFAVRTPRGQKDPGHFRWDPKTNDRQTSTQTIFALEKNDDNLGVHLHGRVIDVDVDTDNVYVSAALDYFLPPTPHIWGRKSRPRTHRLYELSGTDDAPFDPARYPFLTYIKGMPSLEMEIRGGMAKSGQYSLLPGSIHPSGEEYEWDNIGAARSTPVSVDVDKVVSSVRLALAAAYVAQYWVEGQRNQLCMALSGFLYRAVAHAEDMGNSAAMYFDKADALRLLECVMELGSDETSDRVMRLRTFEQTWEKAEKGQNVAGATSMAKMTDDAEIVGIMYALLTDSPDLVEFDKFLSRFAIRNNTSNIIDMENAGHKGSVPIMSVNDFRNSNMHRTISTSEGGKVRMVEILMSSSRAVRVDGLAFMPGADELLEREGRKYVNQWRGFSIAPFDGEVTDKDVEIFMNYILVVICREFRPTAHWVMAWCADIFKNPASKPGTALVLVGKPGSGKSFLFAEILRKIIGRNHTMQTNTIEALTGQFNQDSENCLLVQCDEALNSRRRADANRLKSMITDKTRRVEPKNVNAYETEDWTRYGFTSNDEKDAVAIVDGQHDRRYTVLHVCEDYATKSRMAPGKKAAFWKQLVGWVEAPDNLAKVHRWLLNYQYEPEMLRTPLDTTARRAMQQHSQRGFDDWLMGMVVYEHPFENLQQKDQRAEESYVVVSGKLIKTLAAWPEFIAYRRLEDSYEHYKRRKGMQGTVSSYNAQQIKDEFRSRGFFDGVKVQMYRVDVVAEEWVNGKLEKTPSKIRVSNMPSKKQLLDYLFDSYGYVVEDQDDQIEMDTPVEDLGDGPAY